jgi:hypothetical protein
LAAQVRAPTFTGRVLAGTWKGSWGASTPVVQVSHYPFLAPERQLKKQKKKKEK